MYAQVDKEDVVRQMQRIKNLQAGSRQVVVAGVNAHVKVGAKGISEAANVFDHGKPRTRVVNDHYIEPGGLAASMGSRMVKGDDIEGKAGLGVGKSPAPLGTEVNKKSKKAVRYGHLVIIGTVKRKTGWKRKWNKKKKVHEVVETGNPEMNRGIGPPHHFVEPGYQAVGAEADRAAFEAMEKKLRKLESDQ